MADLVVSLAAQAELEDGARWYESQCSGLGHEFIESLYRSFSEIREFPDSSPVVFECFRFKTMRRFPYQIIYRCAGEVIEVTAVAHQKRRPWYWREGM